MANPIKIKATVNSVQQFGEGVYEITLVPEGFVPRYKPGQFLHLTVDEYDPAGGFWPESRVFSIASASGSDDIRVVYSVKGKYTKRMEESLKPGATVWLKLPYGDFVIEGALKEGQGAVLVAGGTGVSPFLPFLEGQLKAGGSKRDVRLYYGVRRNAMLLGADLLGRCAAGGIQTAILVEDEEPQFSIPVPCARGRLNIEAINAECSAMVDPAYFLSGPPQMIQAFKKALLSDGTVADNIFIDEWE